MNKNIFVMCSLFLLSVICLSPIAKSQEVFIKILDNGSVDDHINIVMLAEGFTSAEQVLFNIKSQEMLDYMLSTSPMSDYVSYFNAYTIFVESVESGSDHPFTSVYKNTYFSSSYDSYGLQRLITIPPNEYDGDYFNGAGKIYDLLITNIPQYDIVILIVNDPEYGGSGGSIAVTSVHSESAEVVVHELGHSFADLGDEYETFWASAPTNEDANTTKETIREQIKWNQWILPATPIPTPETSTYSGDVGLFEGAHYNPTGWYRPQLNCKMRSLGVAFCKVCAEQMVLATYNFVSPIQLVEPTDSSLTVESDVVVMLEVFALQPENHEMDYEWTINGTILNGYNESSLDVSSANLLQGNNVVEITVFDASTKVINDPGMLLTDSWIWNVFFESCCVEIRGNVDSDALDQVDISDLVMLVDFIFTGGEAPLCLEEANVDGDAGENIDISDLVYLVDFIFTGGAAPAVCP